MAKATQFSVALDNKAGALAKLFATLKRAKANLYGISVSENVDGGWVRIVTDAPGATRSALKERGYHFNTHQVMILRPINRAGELEKISRKLGKAGLNINYVYGTSGIASSSTLVLSVSDLAKAERVLDKGW